MDRVHTDRLLENVLDSLPLPVFYKDARGLYLGCNSAFEKFFGLTRAELAGKSVHDIFDRERADKFREMDRKLYLNPGRQVYESRVLDARGQLREVLFHKATFSHAEGGVAGIVGAILDTTDLKMAERKLSETSSSFNRIFDAIPDLLSLADDNIQALPVSDDPGAVVMAAEYLRNITARKEAEHALRQANHLLEALINASPLAIVAFDTDVRLTLWNNAAESMFEWKKEEVLSKPYPIIPEDRIEEVRNNIRLMQEGEVCRSLETRRKRKDGSLVDVSLSTAVMSGPDGAVIGYMSIMSDITERKRAVQALRESEERFRRIFEEDEDAALILAPQSFSIADANAAAARLYGYSKKELRKHTPDLFLEAHEFSRFRETFALTDAETASRGTWRRIDRLDVLDRSGKRIATSVRGRIFITQGTPYLYCTFRDITEKLNIREERKRFEERLIQANKMAALGTLASGIAHEINNPNNYIMSSTQFLHEAWRDIEWILLEYGRENGDYSLGGLPDAEAIAVIPQLLLSLKEGSVRIKNIVENLKSFARQEKQPYGGTVDVNMATKAALSLLGNQIHTYTDSFVCELDEGLPPVPGSLQQIEQVIINLTMNALQALPYKRCGVRISTAHDTAANQVVIQVSDQGRGIPPDMLRRIMEPFFTTKQEMGGTGLGLSICYSIVKKHQGTIDCESTPDRGTVFSVRLPVAGAES